MKLYHVTHANAIGSVSRQGLRTSTEIHLSRRSERERLSNIIDKVGREFHDDWLPRNNALYFWPTLKKAKKYSIRHLHPAIVVVDCKNRTFWQTPNKDVEKLYRLVCNEPEPLSKQQGVELTEEVVKKAQPWYGSKDGELEIWSQSPLPRKHIVKIIDHKEKTLKNFSKD